MTILEENHHSFLIVEHDPMLYEALGGDGPALAPALDPHLQKITELADRVFCIYSEPARGCAKAEAKMPPGDQRTLEVYGRWY